METVLLREKGAYAVLEDRRLVEYCLEGESETSQVDKIYKGRVVRILSGMDAAFVDIGRAKNGFLPMKEAGSNSARPLQTGDSVMVQVKKDEIGDKGVYLTRDIAIPGTCAMLMPMNGHVGVSKRVTAKEQREALRTLGESLCPEGMGLVIRSHAAACSAQETENEIRSLLAKWEKIRADFVSHAAPYLLSGVETVTDELLKKYVSFDRMVSDVPETGWETYTGDVGLFRLWKVEDELKNALERKVWLKSGANLVIDRCEAMTVIDINSGKNTGKKMLEDTLYRINLEACEEIALQCRARNLSGMIIIDFMDMEQEKHREGVRKALEEALKKDKVKTVVYSFTTLGLLEMTRKRTSPPLRERIAQKG